MDKYLYDSVRAKSEKVLNSFPKEYQEYLRTLKRFTEFYHGWFITTREMVEDAYDNGLDISQWVMVDSWLVTH